MGKNDKTETATPPTETPVIPVVDVTPATVLAKLKDAIGSADPFTMDPRIARIRQAGIGLAEALHRAESARKHVITLDSVASDLAQKAMITLADAQNATQSPDLPKRRGRPPGSTNKTPTSDSPAGAPDAPTLAD